MARVFVFQDKERVLPASGEAVATLLTELGHDLVTVDLKDPELLREQLATVDAIVFPGLWTDDPLDAAIADEFRGFVEAGGNAVILGDSLRYTLIAQPFDGIEDPIVTGFISSTFGVDLSTSGFLPNGTVHRDDAVNGTEFASAPTDFLISTNTIAIDGTSIANAGAKSLFDTNSANNVTDSVAVWKIIGTGNLVFLGNPLVADTANPVWDDLLDTAISLAPFANEAEDDRITAQESGYYGSSAVLTNDPIGRAVDVDVWLLDEAGERTTVLDVEGEGRWSTSLDIVYFFPSRAEDAEGPITPITYEAVWEEGTARAQVSVDLIPVDDPPVLVDDAAETVENQTITVDVFANDIDIDGPPLTSQNLLLRDPVNRENFVQSATTDDGTWSVVSGGVRFAPADGYFGETTVEYIVIGPDQAVYSATIDMVVTEAIAAAPIANADSGETPVNTPLRLSVLDNDTSEIAIIPESLQITSNAAPEAGVWEISGTDLLFTPAPRFEGEAQVSYQIFNAQETLSDPATVTIDVTRADYAVSTGSTGLRIFTEDGDNRATLLGFDGDAQWNRVFVSAGGTETLLFSPEDPFGANSTADLPDALTEVRVILEDVSTGARRDNFSDAARVTFEAGGALISFDEDGDGVHNDLSLRLTGVKAAVQPEPVDDIANGVEDQTLTTAVLENDFFELGAPIDISTLRLIDASDARVRELSLAGATAFANADGTVTLRPDADFAGALPAFAYVISDIFGTESSPGTIRANFSDQPDAPDARDDNAEVTSGRVLNLATNLGNGPDSDPDSGDSFEITAINQTTLSEGQSLQLESGIQVTHIGGTSLRFDAPGFGQGGALQDSFTYTLTDSTGLSDVASVAVSYSQTATQTAVFSLADISASTGLRFTSTEAGARAGRAVSGVGDVTGDGLDDVLIGMPLSDAGGTDSGAVHLFGGSALGLNGPQVLDTIAPDGFEGRGALDLAGGAVAGAGDFNGDGQRDLLIGAAGTASDGSFGAEAAYIAFAPPTGLQELAGADVQRLVAPSGSLAGYAVATAGDVNGDGIDDAIIGAPLDNSAYILFGREGPAPAARSLNAASNGVTHLTGGTHFGGAVAGAGDVNGDGFDDILVGAEGENNAYLILGGYELGDRIAMTGGGQYSYYGSSVVSLFGRAGTDTGSAVAGVGDVNGDGYDDILIGAKRASPGGRNGAGEAYLVYGSASLGFGLLSEPLSEIEGVTVFEGAMAGDALGTDVAGVGDMNGDGINDVALGSPGADDGLITDRGEVSVIFGSGQIGLPDVLTPDALDGLNGLRIEGIAALDRVGSALSGAGDVNGDGLSDIVIGAELAGNARAGEAYIVYGRSGGFWDGDDDIDRSDLTSGQTLHTGPGDDAILTGSGDDTVYAGSGSDRVDSGAGDDIVVSSHGADTLDAGAGDDFLLALSGSATLLGRSGADVLIGGIDNDTIDGGSGNDVLLGDVLPRVGGADTIRPGAGDDLAAGGHGPDTFIFFPDEDQTIIGEIDNPFSGSPRIVGADFMSGVDSIVLSGFDFRTSSEAFAAVQTIGDDLVLDAAGTRIVFADVAVIRETDFVLMEIG